MKRKPIIAIVGRPNVGKSTFVNRLVGKRQSIVDDQPGVTRDRIYFDVEWQDKQFTVIDTGGIVPGDEDEIMLSIYDQAKIACDEADKIIFIVDGIDGVTPVDEDIANILRQSDKPIFLAVNKVDSHNQITMIMLCTVQAVLVIYSKKLLKILNQMRFLKKISQSNWQ